MTIFNKVEKKAKQKDKIELSFEFNHVDGDTVYFDVTANGVSIKNAAKVVVNWNEIDYQTDSDYKEALSESNLVNPKFSHIEITDCDSFVLECDFKEIDNSFSHVFETEYPPVLRLAYVVDSDNGERGLDGSYWIFNHEITIQKSFYNTLIHENLAREFYNSDKYFIMARHINSVQYVMYSCYGLINNPMYANAYYTLADARKKANRLNELNRKIDFTIVSETGHDFNGVNYFESLMDSESFENFDRFDYLF